VPEPAVTIPCNRNIPIYKEFASFKCSWKSDSISSMVLASVALPNQFPGSMEPVNSLVGMLSLLFI